MGFNSDCYSDDAYALSARLSNEKPYVTMEQAIENATGNSGKYAAYKGERLPLSFSEPIHTNAKGGKQSDIRVRFDLLPASATKRVAETLHHGAVKYGEANWHNISTNEHLNHALNHIFVSLETGHEDDEDLVHAACRLLMAVDRLHHGEVK